MQKAAVIYKQASNTEKRQILRFLSPNYLMEDGKVIPAWAEPSICLAKIRILKSGGADGARTRDILRDRQVL